MLLSDMWSSGGRICGCVIAITATFPDIPVICTVEQPCSTEKMYSEELGQEESVISPCSSLWYSWCPL